MKYLIILILVFSVSFLNVDLLLANQYLNAEAQESKEEKEISEEEEEEEFIFFEHHKINSLLSAIFYPSSYANYEGPSLPTRTRPPKFSI